MFLLRDANNADISKKIDDKTKAVGNKKIPILKRFKGKLSLEKNLLFILLVKVKKSKILIILTIFTINQNAKGHYFDWFKYH